MLDRSDIEIARQAFDAIDKGDTLHGLITLECSPALRSDHTVNSYLAYCMAKERDQVQEGLQMCQVAMAAEPKNPAHYLNLGRIHLLAGDKSKAIGTFWKGISKASSTQRHVGPDTGIHDHSREHALILDELRRLGIRKRLPFPSLDRSHPLNKFVGKLLAALGLR